MVAENRATPHAATKYFQAGGARRDLPAWLRAGLCGGLALAAGTCAAADPTPELGEVLVVASTPLAGIGLSREQIPANVQTATTEELQQGGSPDLSEFLNRHFGSLHVNDVQGSPFMNDVSYRGYTASPLLGTPQGLSVYMDGVRLNQPFGDVVMWDMIPKGALAGATLMSGANPMFGLNTLGGALAFGTKDGLRNPGTALELGVGSFGRGMVQLEHGGSNDKGLNWYLLGTGYHEDGWRDASPARLGQFFGKLGWRDADSELNLSYARADNKLNGNGAQEQQLLANDYASVYTRPDTTKNNGSFLNLDGKTAVGGNALLSGNAYYRKTRTATLNGDLNEGSLGESVYYTGQAKDKNWLLANGYGAVAAESGNSKTYAFPQWRCIAQAGLGGEPNEKCNGLINTSSTRQENFGLSGQITLLDEGQGWRNQAVLGGGVDASRIRFGQASQFAYLNPDLSLTPVNAWADGSQDSENAFDQRVDLGGKIRTWSLFGNNTLSLDERWHLSAAGRFNDTSVRNRDLLYPYNNATIQNPDGLRGSLDGDHQYRRFNPALGVSFTPSRAFNFYGGYSESSRAPTSIELGCADPDFGCRLPNSMAGDPYLKQVVSKTWEAGIRGKPDRDSSWNLGAFRGNNYDDILFVANSVATGYFRNFGQTRRSGLEASFASKHERLSYGLNYTWMNASYQSSEAVGSDYNSAADANGHVAIKPGDRIPLIPQQILKARLGYAFNREFTAGLEMMAVGGSFVRGNENNAHTPDGVGSFGSGRIPGYSIFNLSAQYQPSASLKLFASVKNLFDRKYYTAGLLGPYAVLPGGGYRNSDSVGTTFYTPGAPRAIWLGLRYEFGKTTGKE
jgi:outer membrane receptor protein involved in Fe transport